MNSILVTRSSMPEFDEYIEEIRDMWDSHWLTNMGVKHKQFQKKLIEYLKIDNIELLTNGHMALELGIQALGLTEGEVITTPFTFASTTHAIVRNGLTPVFCDIDPVTFTIDANKLVELVTERTVAILPVHVYGNICNIEEIDRIAKKYKLKVIYDAAHAFGEEYKGIGIGSYGDISCFSFHATKVFNSIEGGAVAFRDVSFGKTIYQLKNFGIKNEEEVDGIGANAKMNEFCAAMGLCNLRHIDGEIAKRGKIVERYCYHLDGIAGLRLNSQQLDVKSNYSYFPVVFDERKFGSNRDEVKAALAVCGIGARKYFYPLTNTFECFRGRYENAQVPIAQKISRRILTLPLYADLSMQDVDKICDIILKCKKL